MPYFRLSNEEIATANAFIARQETENPSHGGAIGGRWTYTFTPTSLGVIASIVDNVTKATEDLTDFSNF